MANNKLDRLNIPATRNWNIGNFNAQARRTRPNFSRVNNFLNSMSEDFSPFDVYLWGSFPEKTWDLDLLLHSENLPGTDEMERISLNALENSLVKNNFYADVGFTSYKPRNFGDIMDNFVRNGEKVWQEGYIYGPETYVDGELVRDRKNGNLAQAGSIDFLDNNVMKVITQLPYFKMEDAYNANDGSFDKKYKNKPKLIRKRGK